MNEQYLTFFVLRWTYGLENGRRKEKIVKRKFVRYGVVKQEIRIGGIDFFISRPIYTASEEDKNQNNKMLDCMLFMAVIFLYSYCYSLHYYALFTCAC